MTAEFRVKKPLSFDSQVIDTLEEFLAYYDDIWVYLNNNAHEDDVGQSQGSVWLEYNGLRLSLHGVNFLDADARDNGTARLHEIWISDTTSGNDYFSATGLDLNFLDFYNTVGVEIGMGLPERDVPQDRTVVEDFLFPLDSNIENFAGAEDNSSGTNSDGAPTALTGDNEVYLGDHDDVFYLGTGDDTIDAGGGDDTVSGGPGTNVLNGGDTADNGGIDTAVYAFDFADVTVETNGDTTTVTGGADDTAFHDTLTSFEILSFLSGALNLIQINGAGFLTAEEGIDSSGTLTAITLADGESAGFEAGDMVGTHGTFSLASDGSWTYVLSDEAALELEDGDSVVETFSVTATREGAVDATAEMSITVNGATSAPESADKTVSLIEGRRHTFAQDDFFFTDADNHTFVAVIVTRLPSTGQLTLNDEALSVGTQIAVADLDGLVWASETGVTGEAVEALGFQVVDSGPDGTNTSELETSIIFDIAEDIPITDDDDDQVILGTDEDDTILGGPEDELVSPRAGNDDVTLGGGADVLRGVPGELLGDTVQDFGTEDAIQLQGSEILRSDVSVELGSAILNIDLDGDGAADGAITLEGDFTVGDFMAVFDGTDTWITFETFLPDLAEAVEVASDSVNGVNNQMFLTGDGETGFTVTLDQALAGAANDNALGVYEIDADGNIVDVTLLFANVKADGLDPVELTSVEDGNTLGFFVVQDGAAWAEGVGDGTLSFVNSDGDPAGLADDNDLTLMLNDMAVDAIIFHSYQAEMNPNGLTRVLSGVEDGGQAITLGFEDGSDNDYQDVVFTVTHSDVLLG